MQADRPWPSLR